MKLKLGMITLSVLLITSCGNAGDKNAKTDANSNVKADTLTTDTEVKTDSSQPMEKDGLKVYAYKESPKFPNASLKTKTPKDGSTEKVGNVKFDYDVQGYELGVQTSDAGTNGLSNSKDGQHIHAILNNEPYMAHYKPGFEKDLKAGHYVLLSFLSRSYHESVKNPAAADLIQFNVGETDEKPIDLNAPLIFYSRPKGSYKGDDTKKLLLDFYLVNCKLSPDGYKVRATLNGTEFMLTDWSAYIVEGLPLGDVTVKLELLDSNNNLVESAFNPSERTIKLEKGDQ